MDLSNCVPADKHDHAAVERAVAIGYPDINPVLPDLLAWLQDANWPVAEGVVQFLADAGPEITPHIIAVFSGSDFQWQYVLLAYLVCDLHPDVWIQIRPTVQRMADQPTKREIEECVAEAATDVLAVWSERLA